MEKKFPGPVYNPISMFGAVVAIVNFALIIIVAVLHMVITGLAPYYGIIAFIIFPVFLILGLILIPIGMVWEKRRRVKLGKEAPRAFYVDLAKSSHRLASIIFASGTILFLLGTAIGSYKAYEFTESVTFCGEICHSVMMPEYVAYQSSPHSRVTCAQCHVGAGADWYVRSKLSGAYQVYATTFNKYPRPIPTPIENLRPARETCEQCHWPDKFHGSQAKTFDHYMVDEENTKWSVSLLIRTGGGSEQTGVAEGIHWHMNIANEIDYIATDPQRQEIAWVRIKNNQGEVREYVNEDNPIEPEEIGNHEVRRMDCIDCHNRPTHIYHSPSKAVNAALSAGKIDATLPSAKRIAIEALIGEYSSRDSAFAMIERQILSSYESEYPEVFSERVAAVQQLVVSVQEIYGRNFFPEMGVRWDVYPDNIGHFLSPGCYRCHNGRFVSEDGKTISSDCNNCHIIYSQGYASDEQTIAAEGLEFKHPVDIEEAWREMACSECHTGTSQL